MEQNLNQLYANLPYGVSFLLDSEMEGHIYYFLSNKQKGSQLVTPSRVLLPSGWEEP